MGQHGEAVLIQHGNHRFEIALFPRLGSQLLRADGEFIHLLAAETFDGGYQIGADALGHKAGLEIDLGVERPGSAIGTHRHPRHGLDAPGHDQFFPAGAHLHGRHVDRLGTRGAKAIDLHTGHAHVPTGIEDGGAGNICALVADGRDAAKHHVVHLGGVQVVALLQFLQEGAQQFNRGDFVKRAILFALAPGRANGIVNVCFSWHIRFLSFP